MQQLHFVDFKNGETEDRTLNDRHRRVFNPLRTNSDLSQTSHYNIKGLLVREVMRIENMITQVKFS